MSTKGSFAEHETTVGNAAQADIWARGPLDYSTNQMKRR